jgi:transcriptional regulator with XRE-family HTH domain
MVTPKTFYLEVGRALRRRREQQRWSPQDVERHGGPSHKTVMKVERGDAIRHDLATRIAEALGLNILDVYRTILGTTGVSADALKIARVYDHAEELGQAALRQMAEALEQGPTRRKP